MIFDAPSPAPAEYVITPDDRAAIHECVAATDETIDNFAEEFRDGDWWVRVREDGETRWITLIPYAPETGMRGGDITCGYDRETGNRIHGPTFGR